MMSHYPEETEVQEQKKNICKQVSCTLSQHQQFLIVHNQLERVKISLMRNEVLGTVRTNWAIISERSHMRQEKIWDIFGTLRLTP